MQVVGSIQKTNDLYVIMALINARSYFRKVREKFYRDSHSLENEIRDYVNTFGFLQKNVNGLDILIEVCIYTSQHTLAPPLAPSFAPSLCHAAE